MPQKIKAVLFDFDGVLRDSRNAIWSAYYHALSAHNVDPLPTKEEIYPYVHHHKEVHNKFAKHVSLGDFLGEYDTKLVELWDSMVAYDGAAEIIKHLSGAGYKIALVTSARKSEGLLSDLGILKYFETIVGGNDTSEHKPHPEPVLLALDRLQIKPNEAVMVGDMAVDTLAARAAGLEHTIGILDGLGTRASLEEAKTEYIIDSLKDIAATIKRIDYES